MKSYLKIGGMPFDNQSEVKLGSAEDRQENPLLYRPAHIVVIIQ